MKHLQHLIYVLTVLVTITAVATVYVYAQNSATSANKGNDGVFDLIVTVGNNQFSAKLYNNKSTQGLLQLLPLTVTMDDLNSNEKYFFLSHTLPVNSERPARVNTGDFMLYGNNCLVLFYKTFSSSYSYTRLGYIENSADFASALGTGSAVVTFAQD